ncbi:MAG: preprotein translocase subunit YajC [Oscillospiraceae bacterium]|nr:preprotein translocase subunit YajC [Oscillospiraceae bacterium]MCD8322598.1 preprotein translocase subunit YajC [Oscillospiraceae bacterium]
MKLNRLSRAVALILLAALAVFMLAGCTTTTTTTTTDDTTSGGGASMIIMLVVLIAVFYFFMIRPENKKKKQAQEMRDSLSVGDEITTIGGIVGKIVSVNDKYVVFETGEDRVRMQVTKWAISSNTKQTEQPQ